MSRLCPRTPFLLSLCPLLGLGGCSDQPTTFGETKAYTARERSVDWNADHKTRLMLRDAAGQAPVAPQEKASITAKVPDGWEELPARQFRDASWRVSGSEAECALLASVRGGVRGNVDRWCEQFGTARLSDSQLENLPKGELLGMPAKLVEIEGSFQGHSGWKLVGLITDSDPQATLKFTGPSDTVMQNLDKFLALARSLKVGGASDRTTPPTPSAPNAPATGGAAPTEQPATGYTGDLPAGWKQLPSQPARFRDAIFGVPGGDGDCSLCAAVGGGVRMNLDRWTQQFGLPPLSDDTLAKAPQHPLLGKPARLVELVGTFKDRADQMMLALITEGNQVSTFKFTGPKAVVSAEKQHFLELAASLRQGQGVVEMPTKPADTAPQLPPGHGPVTMPVAPAAPRYEATVPADWQPLARSRKELHHSFGTDGEVYVDALGGDLRQLLDIWRGEIGQAPIADTEFAALPKTTLLGGDAVQLDLTGTFDSSSGKHIDSARMLVVARRDGDMNVFVKLVGDAAVVAAQEPAFSTFCSSLRRKP
ncbi:MAG: hypothetical protein IT455_05895 [Planctomycetes bacterium]|nr:hypothetical protein [Planctomycetota bacterium]